ncbi:hypothetical protein PseBG33_1189 [Pseudomonas synxantha BG33R]|uniref:hypothetical protein n=1 Tax=Pseudomonas synxantha TaxID=47883 RepID=UPI00025FE28D|nr:hypothetical protein [Pseudomonas synxantha]EIK69749.1 hypothetical protein PseBG33_1189 [Pseudomonas synxantha BG33R]
MSIIRAPRPEGNFYLLNKAISEDQRLSWAARGLLVFLLGKPDHWEVSTHHLIGQTKDCLGKASGRDAVRGLIRELEQAGYLQIFLERAEGGEFGGRSYTVSESPATDYPGPVEPSPVNPPLVSIEGKQGLNKAARIEKPMADKDMAEAFEVFWKLYPNKKSKKDARKAWEKLKPGAELRLTLMTALGNHRISRDWSKDDGQYVPMASTWLNGERWTDELVPASAAKANAFNNLPTHTPDMYQGGEDGPAF